jgi:uncharacterized protein YdhG (YjbR/CyaY superfamily)
METGKPETIEEYIAGFPPEKRAILENIRATIRVAAPDAKEVISYRMPTFMQNGVLVHYAPLDQPIPYDLIGRIVKHKLKQNAAKKKRA